MEAFRIYANDNNNVLDALNCLSQGPKKLSGVGPATAALILSSAYPQRLPFFSEELYQCFYPGKRDIKYEGFQYMALLEDVKKLMERLETEGLQGLTAVHVEKVAYVAARARHLQGRFRGERADQQNVA